VIDIAAVFGIGVDEYLVHRHRSADHSLLVAIMVWPTASLAKLLEELEDRLSIHKTLPRFRLLSQLFP
jgi:hypothetical protein